LHKITNADTRIPKMMKSICEYLNKYQLDMIIMEKSMLKNNIDTVQKLSNIAGAVMLYAINNNIQFKHPYPSEWRKIIGLQQSSKVKRDVLKAEAIMAVKQEYGMVLTDDEAESCLLARSGFKLPKIVITEEDIWNI
jgi:Holliday junction resolvasome RuvABC endonuclease subunit